MYNPFFLTCETMVDGLLPYGFCRWLGSVQRGATSLAYWGIFSVACNAARKIP